MKKAILLCIVCMAAGFSYAQPVTTNTQKKAVIAPIDSKAKLTPHKTKIKQLFATYQKQMGELNKTLASMRKAFDDATKELETQDKMGNFEIQDLMSTFNQAETLSSNIQKKLDDANKTILQKIGWLFTW